MSELKKKRKKVKDFETPYSVSNMLKDKGTSVTKLSMLVMGLANILNGQIVKGLMFLAMEVGFIAFMIMKGFGFLGDLIFSVRLILETTMTTLFPKTPRT